MIDVTKASTVVEEWITKTTDETAAAQTATEPVAPTAEQFDEYRNRFETILTDVTKHHDQIARFSRAMYLRGALLQVPTDDAQAVLKCRRELLIELGELVLRWRNVGGALAFGPLPNRPVVERPADPDSAEGQAALDAVGIADGDKSGLTSGELQAWLGRLKEPRPSGSAPAAPPSTPTPPQPPPMTPAQQAAFERQIDVLRTLMGQLSRPRERTTLAEWTDEAEMLVNAMQRERIETWKYLSPAMQRAWLAMIVARARAAADPALNMPMLRQRVNNMFPRLSAFSKEEQPGYVHGLAVGHLPSRGTWLADALHAWDELSGILENAQAEVEAIASSRRARAAERGPDSGNVAAEAGAAPAAAAPSAETGAEDTTIPDDEPEDLNNVTPPDAGWSGWRWTRGKRAVIFGGEVHENVRGIIEKAFDFTELAWVSVSQPRRVTSLVTRVNAGTVDLVLVLKKYADHKAAAKVIEACREMGVPCGVVEGAYGVPAVRNSIDSGLGGSEKS